VDGNDGTLNGGASFGAGITEQAFSLDGVDDFVSVPDSSNLDFATEDFTVALWVKFRSTAGEQVLAEKFIETWGPSRTGWSLTKLEGDTLRFGGSLGGDAHILDATPPSIPIDSWIHAAVTHYHQLVAGHREDTYTIYWNCNPIGSATRIDSPVDLDTTASLKFGHRGNPSDTPGSVDTRGFFLNGYIDDVQIFNRALSPSEINDICGAVGSATPTPAPTPTATPKPPAGVGGAVKLPPAAIAAESGVPGEEPRSVGTVALAGVAAGVILLTAGGWYARRRWRAG
jgi:hypothetical protein